MIAATLSETENHEIERQNSLASYSIDYSLAEKSFDEISKLASIICNKPIALITFIDERNQWIKSSLGLSVKHTDRDIAFCNYTIQDNGIFEVTDASSDYRFKVNPLVTGEPNIRFYAGAPLTAPEGHRIGSLCVLDQRPGKLSEQQLEALQLLSDSVVRIIELRKQQKQLVAAREKAEDALRTKADFLSTMSHEIRTPLNGISGIAHLLMDEEHLPHQIKYLKTLKFSANNLMSVVNDILDFSKIEAGGVSFESIPFDLVEMMSEIKNANQPKAQEKKLKLKLKRDDDIPTLVVGDPSRLSQIINNLVSNAIKFTHEGEVVIELQLEQSDDKRYSIYFSVKDTGMGIPEKNQSQLFEPFVQADSSITRRFGGTGLGLTITKRLLELQESKLELVSIENKGSEFSFTLKFGKPEQQSTITFPKNIMTDSFESLHGASILLVEDNEVNVIVAQRIMRNWDVVITHAVNGKEAISLIKSKPYDLVLMDLQMPVMDGYEAATQIRLAGHTKCQLPIIALTASAMLSEKNNAMEAGMNDFVTKPFNPLELYTKIKKHLVKKLTA